MWYVALWATKNPLDFGGNPDLVTLRYGQWLKWSCEAGGGGGGSPDEAPTALRTRHRRHRRGEGNWLEQTPYPLPTQLTWRYLGIK